MKTTPKRILALLLALGLLLSLCACGQKEQTVPDEPKMSTDKVDLLTKADKKTPERQPEEAISQSDMSDRVSRDEATETQPRGEARLEALVKQPADITEIRRAKHGHWKVDPIPQPSKRGFCLL